jgi:hypothetical protein
VRKDERTSVADYIAPPYMLSVEKNSQEINVSLGEYMTRNEIADAFKISPITLPLKRGVAPNQPAPYQGRLGKIWLVAVIAVMGGTCHSSRNIGDIGQRSSVFNTIIRSAHSKRSDIHYAIFKSAKKWQHLYQKLCASTE